MYVTPPPSVRSSRYCTIHTVVYIQTLSEGEIHVSNGELQHIFIYKFYCCYFIYFNDLKVKILLTYTNHKIVITIYHSGSQT